MKAAAAVAAWEIPSDAHSKCDPLLACLVHITGLLGKPCSPDTLLAGLPIGEQQMSPELFVRAAGRLDLSAQVLRRPLVEISTLVLPVVLLLAERGACVLLAKEDTGRLQVLLPESGGVHDISVAELDQRYAGD